MLLQNGQMFITNKQQKQIEIDVIKKGVVNTKHIRAIYSNFFVTFA